MERHWVQKVLPSILLLQVAGTAAQAESIPAYYRGVDYAAVEPLPSYESTARISEITRKSGGALYKLDLAKAMPLATIKVKASSGRAKLINVTLITDKNERIAVKALSNVEVAQAEQGLTSEALNALMNIAMIEVQAEAMGGAANLDISAISNKENPQLALRDDGTCNKKFDAILKEKLDVVQLWAGRAEAATPDSWQEKYASKEFTKYVNDFVATLKEAKNQFASPSYTLTILNFFTDRHNVSRAGSAAEAGYRTMAMETFEVFLASFQSEQQSCMVASSEALIDIALDFQKKQEANKPDSRARKIYEMMISKLGKFIPTQYRKELATKNMSFRQADGEGHKYFKLFAAGKPENFLKSTYQEMSTNAYALAEAALAREVKDLNSEQTYQLIVEFQTKYNDAANFPQETMMKYLTILSEHSYFLMKPVR